MVEGDGQAGAGVLMQVRQHTRLEVEISVERNERHENGRSIHYRNGGCRGVEGHRGREVGGVHAAAEAPKKKTKRAGDRKSVVVGKSVGIGGWRIIKKKISVQDDT